MAGWGEGGREAGRRESKSCLSHQKETCYLLAYLTTRIPKLAELVFTIRYFEVSSSRRAEQIKEMSMFMSTYKYGIMLSSVVGMIQKIHRAPAFKKSLRFSGCVRAFIMGH